MVSEYNLLKKIIKENPERKEFYVLDIGAGNFGFGHFLVDKLNADPEISRDIKVHVIGLRGETNATQEIKEIGICKLYNLGYFKIEDIIEEFSSRKFDLDKKIDLLVSRWTFRHLVDPLGTFLQAYTLLRPETGYLLMDGFLYLRDNNIEDKEAWSSNRNMHWILHQINASYLIYGYDGSRSLDQLILRRLDSQVCNLPLSYIGVNKIGWGNQIESNRLTSFKTLAPTKDFAWGVGRGDYMGNKALYDFLMSNNIIQKGWFSQKYPDFVEPSVKCENYEERQVHTKFGR